MIGAGNPEPHDGAGLYDLDEIAALLRKRASEWVPQHFPGGRREGMEWRLANIDGDPPRKNGSCVISLVGEHAGDWIEFDGGGGGGPIDALAKATGLGGRALFAYAAKLVGIEPIATTAKPRKTATKHRSSRNNYEGEIDAIMSATTPIAGTVGEKYLKARRLDNPGSTDLLFHPDLAHWESRSSHPAMVAIIRGQTGERMAIHRTWLSADGSGKAERQ